MRLLEELDELGTTVEAGQCSVFEDLVRRGMGRRVWFSSQLGPSLASALPASAGPSFLACLVPCGTAPSDPQSDATAQEKS